MTNPQADFLFNRHSAKRECWTQPPAKRSLVKNGKRPI